MHSSYLVLPESNSGDLCIKYNTHKMFRLNLKREIHIVIHKQIYYKNLIYLESVNQAFLFVPYIQKYNSSFFLDLKGWIRTIYNYICLVLYIQKCVSFIFLTSNGVYIYHYMILLNYGSGKWEKRMNIFNIKNWYLLDSERNKMFGDIRWEWSYI